MIREAQIKAALIDHLFAEGWIDDGAVIVSEMPVPSWTRRADLVVANGNLIAFEIKSDGDKMTRLPDQVKAYESFFERVIVVAGPRHVSDVLATTPPSVGVIVANPCAGGVQLDVRRKGRSRGLTAEAALRLMLVRDLAETLKKAGAALPSKADRATLESFARDLPLSVLRDGALVAVKRRYRQYYQAFLCERKAGGSTLEIMGALRKPAWGNGRSLSSAAPQHSENSLPTMTRLNVIPRAPVTRRVRFTRRLRQYLRLLLRGRN